MKILCIDFIGKSVIWQIEDVSIFHSTIYPFCKKLSGKVLVETSK